MSEAQRIDPWGFKKGALVYPQPVAFACGRVLRATQSQERIDACLKAAEILCRYLCALALSSLRGRSGEKFPATIKTLEGNLSFGDFLSIVQAIAKVDGHPLTPYFTPFRSRKKGEPGKADQPIVKLLELRNELGHDLATLQKARATSLLNKHNPEQRLLDAFGALEGVLNLPLFVLENLSIENKQIVGQRLLLMGENPDPIPDQIRLRESLEDKLPYVAIGSDALLLPPVLLFELVEEQCAYRLAFLDGIKEGQLRFKTQDSKVIERNGALTRDVNEVFAGKLLAPEPAQLLDGTTMPQAWVTERASREAAGKSSEGLVPWDDYSSESLEWYARRLSGDSSQTARARIATALLDGRANGLAEDELLQLQLLFGTEKSVRKALRRDMSDFRAISEPGARWDERVSGSKNILDSLSAGIEFFAKHVGMDQAEVGDLSKTTGSADYIAMREALVNQFIHQDYADKSAPAQVELSPERAVFFNAGHSLVTQEHLTDGGKSQARNPIIARGLRLIGFAELAGSGVRALQYAWRKAQRRPPVLESDRVGNTFALTLDWREVPNVYDEVWKQKLGVQLSTEQAVVLNLATDPAGITEHQAAAGAGLSLADARQTLGYLVTQVLLEERGERFHLKEHLKESLE